MKKLYVIISLVFLSCADKTLLREVGQLKQDEISALQFIPETATLWGLEDSGNDNVLYNIANNGSTVAKVTVADAVNTDWEALAADNEGNLYIGDFGNNDNTRKDLAIYQLNAENPDSVMAKIEFYYPEQSDFPPKKTKRFFDCEAFLVHDGDFYLFTKNRSAKFDGSFSIYKVPNKAGKHRALLVANLTTCGNYNKCAITDADISPDGTKAVLLTGDKVIVIEDFGKGILTNDSLTAYDLGHLSQKEGVCFRDSKTLLIADEKDKQAGGKLYELKLDELQAKP